MGRPDPGVILGRTVAQKIEWEKAKKGRFVRFATAALSSQSAPAKYGKMRSLGLHIAWQHGVHINIACIIRSLVGYSYYFIWYDMIWYDMIWYDMIWYDMIWNDMIWYDFICTKSRPKGRITMYNIRQERKKNEKKKNTVWPETKLKVQQ